MKILVVDDDPIACALIEAALVELGHEVVLCNTGEAAWEKFVDARFRIVVSDWNLPGMDGLDLCRRIREGVGEYTYFILLTNLSSTEENQTRAIRAGIDDFLSKPLNRKEIAMRLFVADRILQYTKKVERLESFIPICSYCKKIRDDSDYWQQIEAYLHERSGAKFSHGICPDCYDRAVDDILRKK